MTLRSGVVILARSDSTRLPNKSLREIAGLPIMAHQMRRLRRAKRPAVYALATTERVVDNALCSVAMSNDFSVFRGSPHDVVLRLHDAAEALNIDLILAVGGDDVFCAPELVDQLIEAYLNEPYDFGTIRGAVFGISPYAVTREAIERLIKIRVDDNTDGWERYFTETGLFIHREFDPCCELFRHPELRLDLDYPEDLQLVKAIYESLGGTTDKEPSVQEVVELLLRKPELAQINKEAHARWIENRQRSWPMLRWKTPTSN